MLAQYLLLMKRLGKIRLYTHLGQEVGYTNNWAKRMWRAKEGLTKGFPDYVVITNSHILFLELKRTKGGTVSQEQKEWITELGFYGTAVICHGFDAAKKLIEECL